MRIWVQSAMPLGRVPLWEPYEKALEAHVQKVARSGNTVDVHGVETMFKRVGNSHYFISLNTSQIIDNAIKAEKQGYDAFALSCSIDIGFFELREVLNIPVAFFMESACHVACLLAPKFALLCHDDAALLRHTEAVKRYGLGERLVPSESLDTPIEAVQECFENPAPLLEKIKVIAKKVKKQGGYILIPSAGCLSMILTSNGVRELEGVRIMDVVGTVVKMAELLVDLSNMGVERAGPYAPVRREDVSAFRELLGTESY